MALHVKKSEELFDYFFSTSQIKEVIELHISENTARGQDGIDFKRFSASIEDNVSLISDKTRRGVYKFTPYKEKLILKGANSLPRRISIATIRDRVALRCLNNFLCSVFDDCRPQHAHPVVTRAIKIIHAAQAETAFLKIDVKNFYDEINHDALIKTIRKRIKDQRAVSLISAAIRNPTGATIKEEKYNEKGVPQGLSISNVLSSIYLHDLDLIYSSRLDLSYTRYVDDILISLSETDAVEAFNRFKKKLKRTRGLQVHPLGSGKSEVIPSSEWVQYLGYRFRAEKVTVRESSIKKAMTSIMRIVYGMNHSNLEKSLWRLNIRIAGCRIEQQDIGWMFYFSQINDHQALFRMDAQIKTALARVGQIDLIPRCKSFMKSYREIKYNRDRTTYFFDFDKFSREEMIRAIVLIKPKMADGIDMLGDDRIRSIFFGMMYREAREMERDTLGSFS